MIQAFGIMINGVWSILNISIPISSNINFKLWQFFFFVIFFVVIIKQLFNKMQEGGGMGGMKK